MGDEFGGMIGSVGPEPTKRFLPNLRREFQREDLKESDEDQMQGHEFFDGGECLLGLFRMGGDRDGLFSLPGSSGCRYDIAEPEMVFQSCQGVFKRVEQGFDGGSMAVERQSCLVRHGQIRRHQDHPSPGGFEQEESDHPLSGFPHQVQNQPGNAFRMPVDR